MIKYRIVFNRKKRLKTDGTALVQIEIYADRDRKYLSTGISVAPKDWSDKEKCIRASHPREFEYNFRLKDLKSKIDQVMREYALKEKTLTIDVLINRLDKNENMTLVKFIELEIEKDEKIKRKTKTDFYNTRNKLIDFKPTVMLNQVDYRFVSEWDNYLLKNGLSINTVAKLHKNLKRFLNLAINYELIRPEDYAYRNFKVKHESTKREALSTSELEAIECMRYERKSVNELIQDMFLFACYTGLRISDVTRLKTGYLSKTHKGWSLDLVTFKAKKRAFLPLWMLYKSDHGMSKPEMIVDRYYTEHNQNLFPEISEAKINRQLKVMAKDTNLQKNLTFHMARHTFGTLMASRIPLGTLQELMQHSDIKTTMIYVNMTRQIIEDDLGKVDWNL